MKPGARPCLLIGSRCWETPPLARSGESPDWLACLALGFHSQKSMKQRERGGGGGRGVRTGGRASGGVQRVEAVEAKEMHQSAAPRGCSQQSAAPGKPAGARGTPGGRGRLAPA